MEEGREEEGGMKEGGKGGNEGREMEEGRE